VNLLNRHIFLILSLLAMIASGLFYAVLERGAISASDEQYLRTVQERVRQELLKSQEELALLQERLDTVDRLDFTTFGTENAFPYYVFRNRKLVYWSDHRVIPDYSSLQGGIYPRLVSLSQGKYLVSRRRLQKGSDTLDVFSLVNVYRRYLHENNYLRSGYNPALFTLDPAQITLERGNKYENIYDSTPLFLFAVKPPRLAATQHFAPPVNTVVLASLALLFLGIYVARQMVIFGQRRRYGQSIVLLVAYLLILRAVMLYFRVPFVFVENVVFHPKYYTSSLISPSLGDLLLNSMFIALVLFYTSYCYFRTRLYYNLLRQPVWARTVISLLLVILTFGVFYACLSALVNIYENSRFTLDITLSISFSTLKIACLLVFVAVSAIYYLAIQILVNFFIRLNVAARWGFVWLLLGSGLAVGGLWALGRNPGWILAGHGVYLLILYVARFPRTYYTFQYKTSIYLFLGALMSAFMSTYVVYKQEIRKDILLKQEFGRRLLAENDGYGEFLLSKAQASISQDTGLRQILVRDTLFLQDRIRQRIQDNLLDRYFDKYELEVLTFDAAGLPVDSRVSASAYDYYTSMYQQERFRTQYPNLYFLTGPDQPYKQYISFVELRSGASRMGFLVLRLRLRDPKESQQQDERPFIQAPDTPVYSYVVYDSRKRIQSTGGVYNYERRLPLRLLADPALYSEGVSVNGHKHVGQHGDNGRIIVVSSGDYPVNKLLANFSFLYLVLILHVLLILGAYAIRYRLQRNRLNYAAKTQLLLNAAFFAPLLLIVIITLSVIRSNYDSNQQTSYLNVANNLGTNFKPVLENYLGERASKAFLEQELRKIAGGADLNLDLYDAGGYLLTTTQPLLFEGGHLSKYINPKAYQHLIEDKEYRVLLTEQLGTKKYRSTYVAMKSLQGELIGILNVPHFDSQAELNRQFIDVISTIISVFTGLLLLFLAVSFWASTFLTKPLGIITQRLRKTNLDKLNEPLQWRSDDDEIGLLISAYNRMLLKLEESKRALSQSEKQSAWREMAKQVAHEIKNPLTPMKLTLQHLQRTLPADNPNSRRVIQRTLNSLLDQIDNLSDIATSFSDFAKMPLPKNELFEITTVINKAADLYADDEKITLERDIAAYPVMVMGDRQLIGRILTNLIINGIQSVPEGRKPLVELKLWLSEGNVNIVVSDNGHGIPEPIRNKVFLPNFSTKEGGSGLGLAIAKRGIEHAGGSIWFETEDSVGTTFFISLPQAELVPVEKPKTRTSRVS